MTKVMVALALCSAMGAASSAEYNGLVSDIQPNHSTANCFFFRLEGVTITPASPGNWFAVSYTSNGAKETFASVLAAKLSGVPVKVTTLSTTPTVCNYAEATYVAL
jgi:hypothetical protein